MTDASQGLEPFARMGDFVRYFEIQSKALDKYSTSPVISMLESSYTSMIRFNGIPILPPVMTLKRKEEMQSYRRQAQYSEKRTKSRQRLKLMARAQSIVEDSKIPETDVSERFPDESTQTCDRFTERPEGENQHSEGNIKLSSPHEQVDKSDTLQTNIALTYAMMDSGQMEEDRGLQTLDSLSSDFLSLEEGSLPTDFSGIPLTSVKHQQITQTLARLSKALNIKESQSLGSTGSSEISEMGQTSLKLSLGCPVPSASRLVNPALWSQTSENSSIFHDSQDTIVEVSQELTGNSTSGFVDNTSSSSPQTNTSPGNLTIQSPSNSATNTSNLSSGNTSTNTTDSQRSNKSSPKSLKNTVHFASFVTEITRQSVEDNITMRRLELTPTNSPREQSHEQEENMEKPMLSKLPVDKNRINKSDISGEKTSEDLGNSRNAVSLLSKVDFVPDGETTPSPDQMSDVPFQCYTVEAESSTSDKENDQGQCVRVEFQPQNASVSVSDLQVSGKLSVEGSVSDFQTSMKSNLTSGTSESESSTLKGDSLSVKECVSKKGNAFLKDNMSTRGSSNILVSPTGTTSVVARTVTADSDKHMRSTISALQDGDPTVSLSRGPANDSMQERTELQNDKLHDGGFPYKKGHVRKGSYTLSEPSPVLLQTQVKSTTVVDSSDTVLPAGGSVTKPLQRKLDYEEEEEHTNPVNIPMPPGPEAEGKVEHIKKYLSHVQQQNMGGSASPQSSAFGPKSRPDMIQLNGYPSQDGSTSIIQSLFESMDSLPDMSQEDVLKLQAKHIEMLHKEMIEQQRKELEELFVQQRKEQLQLQNEVEQHQKHLREQQEFLFENAPENMKKMKSSNSCHKSGDIELSERKIQNSFQYVSSPSLYMHPNERDNVSTFSKTTPKRSLFLKSASPKVYHPVVRSPVRPHPLPRRTVVHVPEEVSDPRMKKKFDKLTAAAKGFLARRLLQSEKVQEIMKTIKDTRDFAFSFSAETPIKKGNFSHQDKDLLERIIAQLQAALLDIHEIFFEIPVSERMALIAHTRHVHEEKKLKTSYGNLRGSQPRVSTATLKAIERKRKAQEAEAIVFGAGTSRPRSAPPATSSPRSQSTDLSGPIRRHFQFLFSRALKPLQGQISPIRPEGASARTEKDRPKTAPEKTVSGHHLKSKRTTSSCLSTNASGKQNKPVSTSTKVKVATKTKVKQGKAWR